MQYAKVIIQASTDTDLKQYWVRQNNILTYSIHPNKQNNILLER